jgi:hypothetical protein
MAEYEKIKRITVPLENDHLLLVTREVEADHRSLHQSFASLLIFSEYNLLLFKLCMV